ncbi:MAG: endopeptidase La [Phycisphaerales bacterium]|nr:endopeptidase La [Phycisphaerales bacterium]
MVDTNEEIDLIEEIDGDEVMPDSVPLAGSIAPIGTPSEDDDKPRIPELLPVLPVRDTVAFPGTIVPLTVGREKSKKLVAQVFGGSKILGVVAQRRGETEEPQLEDLYRVGTVATILKRLELTDGTQSIIVHCLTRFGIESLSKTEPFLVAKAHPREDTFVESTEIQALIETAKRLSARVIGLTPGVPEEALSIVNNIEKPGSLADFLAANLSLGLVEKQELLETFDVRNRLQKINKALARQLEILELSNKIHSQVKEQIDQTQREYYLQEQLQAIQKELGQTDDREAEISRLREQLAKAGMPETVEKEAHRELDRLVRTNQASPEYSGIVDYLEWLCELPWSVSTEDKLDIPAAEKVLDEDHYDLEKVKKRIIEFLAVRKLNPEGRGPILCLAGPPGVGKTSLGQSIARALGRNFIRMSVGGVRDEADIRGHRRTYIGSIPGRIIQELRKAGSNNPVFMIDEVDKIGSDARGDPSSALLEVLDPAQNNSFQDHYLGVPFDLTRVMFICTANYMEAVPPALRDRMEVIYISGYTRLDKLWISKKYLVPRRRKQVGLSSKQIKFTDSALESIIDSYTAEAGVRNLEREIGAVCRGVASEVARGKKPPKSITKTHVEKYLGPEKHQPEPALRTSQPGVVTGLAWTPYGGEIMFIEANVMPGRGSLQLTGQLGDVMRESAQAALSVIRAKGEKYGINAEDLLRQDLHLHVPAGAIPKDGPSAGIAMFTALNSLLTNCPCRSDVAMTGEITLRGMVLPIGGLKEKALAAHHAGIKTIIIPDRNQKDLVEIPQEIRKQIKFVPVKTVDEVLATALASKVSSKAKRSQAASSRGAKPKKKTAKKKTSKKSTKRAAKQAARALS